LPIATPPTSSARSIRIHIGFSRTIDHESLEDLRSEGYCTALCTYKGVSVDGYNMMLQMSKQIEDPSAFHTFLDEYEELDEETLYLNDKNEDYEDEFLDLMVIGRRKHLKFRDFCSSIGFAFEDCTLLKKLAEDAKAALGCVANCMYDLMEDDGFCPSYEAMAAPHQDFLTCMLEFDPEKVILDAENGIDLEQALKLLQRFGFVAFRNFFPHKRMEEIHNILVEWRNVGEWGGRQYNNFMAKEHLHDSDLREEVVIPFMEPFLSTLREINESVVWQVMEQYVELPGFQFEFVTSILSDPGADRQTIHNDIGVPGRMLKGNLALHSMSTENGPTEFCPCTHTRGSFYYTYALSLVECPLHFQPDVVDAGTLIIYDQALEHRGMDNRGNTTRHILDISFIRGKVGNEYVDNFSSSARDDIMNFRNYNVLQR
jgi:Phytanoyl-CoA dioxygenase (PhyH)